MNEYAEKGIQEHYIESYIVSEFREISSSFSTAPLQLTQLAICLDGISATLLFVILQSDPTGCSNLGCPSGTHLKLNLR